MADSADVRTGLDTLIAENWSSTVIDRLFDRMPLMQVFFGRNGTKNDVTGLGIPNSGILLTGMKGAKIKRRQILSSFEYQPLIHHLLPNEADGKVLGTHDSNATRSSWQTSGPEKRFVRPRVKWFDMEDPCKVSNEILDHTKRTAEGERNGWEAIGSLLRVESSDVLGVHTRRLNQLLWGTYTGDVASTTGRPTDEDADKWDAIHSIAEALKTDNVYCGVDRTVSGNEYWHGNYVTTAMPAVFRDLIRHINYDSSIELAKKNGPVDLLVTGGDLFSQALAEADAKGSGGRVIGAGEKIPEMGEFGFKRDSVRIDNTLVIYDPSAPDNVVVGLKPSTWTLAIYPNAAFTQSTPTNQANNEGGDKAHTWGIRTKVMLVCEAPAENVYFTNVG